MLTEKTGQFKAKGSCLKKAEQTALMFLMVMASQVNDAAILFSPVYPSPSPSLPEAKQKKKHQAPPPLFPRHAIYQITRLEFLLKANFAMLGF